MQYYANWGIVEEISFVFCLLFLVLNFCNKEKYMQEIMYVVALGINFLSAFSDYWKKSPLDRLLTTKLNHYFANVSFFHHLHRFHACNFCCLLLARRVYGRSFKSSPFQCLSLKVQSLGKLCVRGRCKCLWKVPKAGLKDTRTSLLCLHSL